MAVTDDTTSRIDLDEVHERYAAERDKRIRRDGNEQYLEMTGAFAHYAEDPYVTPEPRDPVDDEVTAVFIGGAAVTGGVGTVIGSIVGGLVMAVLNNGLQLLGVGADLTQIIKGLVLLIAVAFDVYNKSQGKKSIIGMLMKNFGRSSEIKADETTSTKEVISRGI